MHEGGKRNGCRFFTCKSLKQSGNLAPLDSRSPSYASGSMGEKTGRDNLVVTCNQAVEYINVVWSQSLHVDTDGSKNLALVRSADAFYIRDIKVIKSIRLSDYYLSVFSAELFAIVFGLEWIIDFKPLSAVTFSDSFSALKALESVQSGCRYDLVLEVLHLITMANWRSPVVDPCWIPAYVGFFVLIELHPKQG